MARTPAPAPRPKVRSGAAGTPPDGRPAGPLEPREVLGGRHQLEAQLDAEHASDLRGDGPVPAVALRDECDLGEARSTWIARLREGGTGGLGVVRGREVLVAATGYAGWQQGRGADGVGRRQLDEPVPVDRLGGGPPDAGIAEGGGRG